MVENLEDEVHRLVDVPEREARAELAGPLVVVSDLIAHPVLHRVRPPAEPFKVTERSGWIDRLRSRTNEGVEELVAEVRRGRVQFGQVSLTR